MHHLTRKAARLCCPSLATTLGSVSAQERGHLTGSASSGTRGSSEEADCDEGCCIFAGACIACALRYTEPDRILGRAPSIPTVTENTPAIRSFRDRAARMDDTIRERVADSDVSRRRPDARARPPR